MLNDQAASGYGVYEMAGVGRAFGASGIVQATAPRSTRLPLSAVRRFHLQPRYAPGARSNVPLRLPAELSGKAIPLGAGIPGLTLPAVPVIGFVEAGGLWRLDEKAEPVLSAVLGTMTFAEGPGANDPKTGQTVFVLGQLQGDGMTVVRGFIQAGYAALLDKSSPSTGILQWVFTQKPEIVLARAGGPGATHALVDDEPATVIAAASALATGQGGQLPGTVVGPDGAPVVGPGAETPKWVVPALVGAGVLVVGAIVYAGRKK